MADTLTHARNGGRVWAKILQRLERGSNMSTKIAQGSDTSVAKIKRNMWIAVSADPAIDAGSQGTYPLSIEQLVYRIDTDEVFICSVAPAAATAATFIQLHA